MFRQMRRKDRKMEEEAAKKLLLNGDYGVLSTVSSDGYPYATPLNYVFADEAVYFHCAREGHKLDNIAYNAKVAFCVVGKAINLPEKFSTDFSSVIVFGKAMEVEGKEKELALSLLIKKYASGHENEGQEYINKAFEETAVIRVAVEHITGKSRNV